MYWVWLSSWNRIFWQVYETENLPLFACTLRLNWTKATPLFDFEFRSFNTRHSIISPNCFYARCKNCEILLRSIMQSYRTRKINHHFLFTCEKSSETSFSVYSFGRFVMYNLQLRISVEGGLAKLTFSFLCPIRKPFFDSIAVAASSSLRNFTKPYPKLFFESLSFTTFATAISPCSTNKV